MSYNLEFDYKKAVQTVNFFALKSGGYINKLKVIKLIYFADRYHLRKYGRPITNDEYYAMDYGPVGSCVKDIAEMSEFLGSKEEGYASIFIEAPDRYDIRSKKGYDTDVFSESDLEALNFAWEKFGHYDQFKLADITHEYPEWKKHERALESYSRRKMDYKDFLDDPPSNLEKCYPLDSEEKEDKLSHLEEIYRLESLWS